MTKHYLVMLCLLAATTASAQTYKLTDMTAETFAQGGDDQWSFQKYEYATGKYSTFQIYGDSSTCNFLDYYNPERCMGERITEIDGYTGSSVNNYWAGNIRKAWYDQPYVDVSTDDLEKFIYMSEDFETYAQPKYAGVVSFTVPADGYYIVKGSIVREDCAKMDPLYLIPRYRYEGVEQVDSSVTMGLAFAYGDQGGEIEGSSNWNLSQGAEQRYVAQTPVEYTFAFNGKKGDIVSFETNASRSYGSETYARTCWGRSFFKQLDIETTDQATAEAAENFVDPYDQTGVDDLTQLITDLQDYVEQLEASDSVGNNYGQYTQEAVDNFNSVAEEVFNAIGEGMVSALNLEIYQNKIDEAWKQLMASKSSIDYTAEGNYVLFSTDEDLQSSIISKETNEDNPFGYYSHEVSTGLYTKFPVHGSNKGGTGWCRNANEWFYLNDDGMMHPLTTYSPSVMFTAPADGYYLVGLTCYRPNPNTKVENPLYLRARFVTQTDSTLVCATDEEMFSKEYGSVANDGESGKAPIDLDFFVHLKQGDKIATEIEAYTSNRNSSAGTLFTRYIIASVLGSGTPITEEYVENSGLDVYDPYKQADLTTLQQVADSAKALLDQTASQLGDGEGQYGQEEYDALNSDYTVAANILSNTPDNFMQVQADSLTKVLTTDITALLESRHPYQAHPSGETAIRLAGTNKYLVQKNLADGSIDHFYAGFMSMDDIVADTIKNGTFLSDYQWTWTVNAVDTGGYYLTNSNGVLNANGYVEKTAPDPTDQYNASRLYFYKENENDSTVAICRATDSLYWNTSYSWHSPYDMVNTSEKPVYAFILGPAPASTPTGITTVGVTDEKVSRIEYYTVDGRRTSASAKGLILRRVIFSDGSSKTTKVVVK